MYCQSSSEIYFLFVYFSSLLQVCDFPNSSLVLQFGHLGLLMLVLGEINLASAARRRTKKSCGVTRGIKAKVGFCMTHIANPGKIEELEELSFLVWVTQYVIELSFVGRGEQGLIVHALRCYIRLIE